MQSIQYSGVLGNPDQILKPRVQHRNEMHNAIIKLPQGINKARGLLTSPAASASLRCLAQPSSKVGSFCMNSSADEHDCHDKSKLGRVEYNKALAAERKMLLPQVPLAQGS
jgi:hypothetical protein